MAEPTEEKPIAEIPEEEEDFDFAQMGGDEVNALLKDDEDEFWNSFDDDEEEQSFEETLVEEDEDEKLPEELFPDTNIIKADSGGAPSAEPELSPSQPASEQQPLQEPLRQDPPMEEPAPDPEPVLPPETPAAPESPVQNQVPKAEEVPPVMSGDELMQKLDNMEETLKQHEEELKETEKMKSVLDMEKFAQDLQEQQQAFAEELRKENQQMIQDTVEKTVDEKLSDVVDGYGEEEFPVEEELLDDLNNDIDIVPAADEDFIEDSIDEKTVDSFEDELEDENLDEELSGENQLNTENEQDAVNQMLDEETPIVTVVEHDGIQELQVQDSIDADVLATAVERLNSPEPIVEGVDSGCNNDILNKIERILSDPEVERQYADQIELFKKLRVLSKFLPDSQKNSFLSCKMRVLMEYIISKMSGKPGLLVTAESLLKSGVLGPEYESQLFNSDPAPITDSLVVDVLLTMKDLAGNLEDKDLVQSLYVSIDGILEQIELEEQKKEIF